jgi:hypothetical protein
MKVFLFLTLILLFVLTLQTCQESTDLVTTPTQDSNESTALSKATVVKTYDTFLWDDTVDGFCLGEDLIAYGTFETYAQTVLDGSGGFHTVIRWRALDVLVTGINSGNSWYPLYSDVFVSRSGKVGEMIKETYNGVWKGNQPGPDLLEYWRMHMTVNAKGVVTVQRDNFYFECRGK